MLELVDMAAKQLDLAVMNLAEEFVGGFGDDVSGAARIASTPHSREVGGTQDADGGDRGVGVGGAEATTNDGRDGDRGVEMGGARLTRTTDGSRDGRVHSSQTYTALYIGSARRILFRCMTILIKVLTVNENDDC